MKRRTMWIAAAGAVAVVATGTGVGIAVAGGGDDDGSAAITGDALKQASAAALAETGEGRVTETEVNDEESYYEVEVTLNDGTQVDVQLDKQFHVVGSSKDHEGPGQDDGAGND